MPLIFKEERKRKLKGVLREARMNHFVDNHILEHCVYMYVFMLVCVCVCVCVSHEHVCIWRPKVNIRSSFSCSLNYLLLFY